MELTGGEGEGSVHDTRKYGLYQSLVGPDLEKNDLFENLPTASAPGASGC